MNKYFDSLKLVYIFGKNSMHLLFYYLLYVIFNNNSNNSNNSNNNNNNNNNNYNNSNNNNNKFVLKRLEIIKQTSKELFDLNVNYLKILQALCYEKNYLSQQEQEYLITYTNNAPYNNDDINYELIDVLKNNGVEFIYDTPINSGVSAVVYKGLYKNKSVAIKLLKNNAEFRMVNCIETLEYLISILSKLPYIKHFNLSDLLKLNKKLMMEQVDLNIEKYNILNFKENCKIYDFINVPELYNIELSSNKLDNKIIDKTYMIMEFIEGFNFQELLDLKNDKLNTLYGEKILKFSLFGTLMINSVHCDLHPGNFILHLKDKKTNKVLTYNEIKELNNNHDFLNQNIEDNYDIILNIIDYGLVLFLDDNIQSIYFEYLKKLLIDKNNLDSAKFMLENLNENNNYKNYDSVLNEIKNHLDNYLNDELDLKFIYKLNKIFSKYNLKFIDEIMKIQISLSVSATMTKNLIGKQGLKNTTEKIIKDIIKLNELISFE